VTNGVSAKSMQISPLLESFSINQISSYRAHRRADRLLTLSHFLQPYFSGDRVQESGVGNRASGVRRKEVIGSRSMIREMGA
jgi:hypothetical protein